MNIARPNAYAHLLLPPYSCAAIAAVLAPGEVTVHCFLSAELIPIPHRFFYPEGSATCRLLARAGNGAWVAPDIVIPTAKLKDDWEPVGVTFDLNMAPWLGDGECASDAWVKAEIECYDYRTDVFAFYGDGPQSHDAHTRFQLPVTLAQGITPEEMPVLERGDHRQAAYVSAEVAREELPPWIIDLATLWDLPLDEGRAAFGYNGPDTTRVEFEKSPIIFECLPTLPMIGRLQAINPPK